MDQAETMAKEFVARDMRNPAGYNMLGKIYSNKGLYEQAIESYDKSRNLRQPNVLADKQIESIRAQMNLPPAPEAPEDENEIAPFDEIVDETTPVEEGVPEPVEGPVSDPFHPSHCKIRPACNIPELFCHFFR